MICILRNFLFFLNLSLCLQFSSFISTEKNRDNVNGCLLLEVYLQDLKVEFYLNFFLKTPFPQKIYVFFILTRVNVCNLILNTNIIKKILFVFVYNFFRKRIFFAVYITRNLLAGVYDYFAVAGWLVDFVLIIEEVNLCLFLF